jgi:hypothetical protein
MSYVYLGMRRSAFRLELSSVGSHLHFQSSPDTVDPALPNIRHTLQYHHSGYLCAACAIHVNYRTEWLDIYLGISVNNRMHALRNMCGVTGTNLQ